jgi:hypothetical protein
MHEAENIGKITLAAALLAASVGAALAAERPAWAFFVPSPETAKLNAMSGAYGGAQWSAPGSRKAYTRSQLLMRTAVPNRGTEPIGGRMVELPESTVGLINRDSHSGFIAYVPRGSFAAGKALVTKAGADRHFESDQRRHVGDCGPPRVAPSSMKARPTRGLAALG